MSAKIKIIVADSHVMLRDALVVTLRKNIDFEIVLHTSEGREVLDALKSTGTEIVLLGDDLLDMASMDVLRTIHNRHPKTGVIIMSNSTEIRIGVIKRFIDSGAASFIHTTSRLEILVEAIKETKASGFFMESSISKMLIEVLAAEKKNPLQTVSFKDREHDVFVMVCNGMTNNEIAGKISVSASAIDYHKGRIYRKTGCRNKTQLIVYGLKNDLITLSELHMNRM